MVKRDHVIQNTLQSNSFQMNQIITEENKLKKIDFYDRR